VILEFQDGIKYYFFQLCPYRKREKYYVKFSYKQER